MRRVYGRDRGLGHAHGTKLADSTDQHAPPRTGRGAALSVRLFFAVELPAEVQNALGKLRAEEAWAGDYRWVDPTSMHITLAFLGEQPADVVEPLTRIGQAAASATQRGRLSIGEPGSFGPRRAPRVLWVGLAGDLDNLNQLHTALTSALRQHGFPVEDRAFSPHVTLARRRQHANSGLPPLWPPKQQPPGQTAAVDRLTLFESQLSRAGAHYTAVAHWPIGH